MQKKYYAKDYGGENETANNKVVHKNGCPVKATGYEEVTFAAWQNERKNSSQARSFVKT